MKKVLSILILVYCSASLYAQLTSCTQTLRLANSTYEQGRLHEIPQLLSRCIESGFSKQEKVAVYKLLCLSYIYLEEPEKADEAMLNLLRTDHYFEINPAADPAEFISLYKTFRTEPIYRIGAKAGANACQPNVRSFNAVSDGQGKYKYKLGFDVGVALEIPINPSLTINPELNFSSKAFQGTFESQLHNSTYSTTTGEERQTWISLPLMVRYHVAKDKLKRNVDGKRTKFIPFLSGGICAEYLLSSNITGEKKQSGFQSVEPKSFSTKPQRENVNISIQAGVGLKVRLATGFFIAEAKYAYGLRPLNSASTLLTNQSLLFDYAYIDGIYRLNSLSVAVGYVQNIFDPAKKKNR